MIKIGSFFEENIEKIVLVIVGLVCVWLLITRVIFSPNTVSYNDRNFSPSAIDNHIYGEAELLRQNTGRHISDARQAEDANAHMVCHDRFRNCRHSHRICT